MKKKNTAILILASVCGACLFGACAAIPADSATKVGNTSEYGWTYLPSMAEECDADMKIDGVLDEARWQDKQQLVHTEKGVTMTYTTAFSQKGLYIAACAYDEDIEWAGRLRYNENSCFWFSVKGPDIDTTKARSNEVFNIYVDGNNASSMNMSRFMAKGKTDKPYDEKPETMTAEVFVTWEALNIELGENGELPEFVWINPHYRYVGGTDRETWLNPLLFFDNNDRQQCSGRFSDVGYINADKEDAVIGNAANGFSKSDGWDLSRIGEGVVRSDVDHSQGIFFTDIYSTAYTYTVQVNVLDQKNNGKMGQMGVFDAADEISFNAFMLNQESVLKKEQTLYSTLSFYNEGLAGWAWNDVGRIAPQYNTDDHVITYTVVKDGGYFYYIVNGEFVMSAYIDYLQGATCPGLFALDCIAEFSAYSATDLSDDTSRIDELLEEYGTYRIKTPQVVSGGSIELSSGAATAGGSCTATITPSRGYILTGFTVNGEDKYDEIVAGMVDGRYTFENITEMTELVPTFTLIPQTTRVMGKITIAGEDSPVLNGQLTLWGSDSRLFYTTATSSSGAYTLQLPAAGTQTIGGETYTFDGAYTVRIKASGYKTVSHSFTVAGTGTLTQNYEMERPDYNKDTWGILEDEGVYYAADSLASRTSDYKFFSEASDVAVMQVRVQIPQNVKLPSRYGVGVTFTDGTTLTEDFVDTDGTTRTAGNYVSREIGLSDQGLYCSGYLIGQKMRFPGAWGGGSFSELQYDRDGLSLWANGVTERTLSVVLFENVLYVYIDDTFMLEVTTDDTTYWGAPFGTRETFRFGIFFTETAGADIRLSVTQNYGEDAIAAIQDEALFEEVRESMYVKDSYNISYADGTYTAQGENYYKSSYAYTNEEYNDTIVYSVKLKTPYGLSRYKAQLPNLGITITNGTIIEGTSLGNRYVPYNSYYSAQIGLSDVGIVSQVATNGSLARRIDKQDGFDFTTVDERYAIKEGVTERIFTVVLYKDTVYIYVDNVFACSVAITDANYFKLKEYAFPAGSKYKVGVNATNVDHTVNPVTMQVVKELYGDEALAEIQANALYSEQMIALNSKNMSVTNGVYTPASGAHGMPWGYGGEAYYYTSQASDIAVYSVKATLTEDLSAFVSSAGDTLTGYANIGIYITDNSLYTGNYGVVEGTRKSVQIGLSELGLVSSCMGELRRRLDGTNMYGLTDAANTDIGFAAGVKERTLTVALYKDTLYIYVDGTFAKSVGITDQSYFKDGSGALFTAGSALRFGVGTSFVNSAVDPVSFTVVNDLSGSAALEYIRANYSANITVE